MWPANKHTAQYITRAAGRGGIAPMLSSLPTAGGIICTSEMEKRGALLVHSTRDDSYIVVVKPSEWVVAISNEAVMGYDANLVDLDFEGQHTNCRALLARGVRPLLVEQWKAQSLPIFKEMHVLRNLAHSHQVAHKDVRVVVVRSPRVYAMELIHQEGEERRRGEYGSGGEAGDGAGETSSSILVKNSVAGHLVPGDLEEFNRSRCITTVMQQDVWGREYQAYRQWFQRTYFA